MFETIFFSEESVLSLLIPLRRCPCGNARQASPSHTKLLPLGLQGSSAGTPSLLGRWAQLWGAGVLSNSLHLGGAGTGCCVRSLEPASGFSNSFILFHRVQPCSLCSVLLFLSGLSSPRQPLEVTFRGLYCSALRFKELSC